MINKYMQRIQDYLMSGDLEVKETPFGYVAIKRDMIPSRGVGSICANGFDTGHDLLRQH